MERKVKIEMYPREIVVIMQEGCDSTFLWSYLVIS
jgi:hypothetical protein